MPDHLLESLKAENDRLRKEIDRLRHENHEMIDRIARCVERSLQIDKAFVRAASENFALSRKLGGH